MKTAEEQKEMINDRVKIPKKDDNSLRVIRLSKEKKIGNSEPLL